MPESIQSIPRKDAAELTERGSYNNFSQTEPTLRIALRFGLPCIKRCAVGKMIFRSLANDIP